MAEIIPAAKRLIKHLEESVNYDEPFFDRDKVIKHMRRYYELLGVPMPEVEVAPSLVAGFQIVYEKAWDAARGAAWDAAWDAAWGAARDAARDAAWGAAWDAAWGAAWDAAWGAARDAAWGAARDAARDAARGAARDAARGAASAIGMVNTGLKDSAVLKYIEIDSELLKAVENGLDVFFPMKDKLILVPVPRLIATNNRLHYDHGKAVEWQDGSGFFFLRGVKFEEDLYWKIVNQDIRAEEALNIRDSDQRMAAISMLRPDRLLKQMDAKLIHTGTKGTKLYQVDNFMNTGTTEYCMWMRDASTPREFIEWVDPKIGKQGNADLCQANAWGIPLEDYLLMEQEA